MANKLKLNFVKTMSKAFVFFYFFPFINQLSKIISKSALKWHISFVLWLLTLKLNSITLYVDGLKGGINLEIGIGINKNTRTTQRRRRQTQQWYIHNDQQHIQTSRNSRYALSRKYSQRFPQKKPRHNWNYFRSNTDIRNDCDRSTSKTIGFDAFFNKS